MRLSTDDRLRHIQTLIIAWAENLLPHPPAPTITTAISLARLCDEIQLAAGHTLSADRMDTLLIGILDYLPHADNPDITAAHRAELLWIGDALRDAPAALDGCIPLRNVIAAQRFARRHRSLRNRPDFGSAPPRRPLWESRDGYRFEEATHPGHLQQDTLALGHCIGITHDMQLLQRHGLEPESQAADAFLTYWLRIQRGESRILTFTHDGCPIATLNYCPQTHWVTRIETSQLATVLPDAPYFSAFCKGLSELSAMLPILGIKNLPTIPSGMILTPRGSFEDPTPLNILSALGGTIPLPRNVSFVPLWTQNPRLNLDISAATPSELAALPPIIRAGWLVHNAPEPLRIPAIVEAYISTATREHLELPMHREGNIVAPFATAANLSTRVGLLNLPAVKSICMPSHQRGRIAAKEAETVILANHVTGSIDAGSSTSLAAPRMEQGDVHTGATFISLPNLRNGNIHAPKATAVYAPKLKSGCIFAPNAGCHPDVPD